MSLCVELATARIHQLQPANDNQIQFEFSMPDEYQEPLAARDEEDEKEDAA